MMKKKLSASEAFMALPDEEKERQWAEFNKPFIFETARPLSKEQRALWEKAKRKVGRPREGQGVKVISLSVEKGLLNKADRLAKTRGVTRAQVVADALKLLLAKPA